MTLALISVNAPFWPAPAPESSAPEAKGPLIVNYCTRGRCELVLNDNKSVFLTAEHISLTEKFALNEYVYPGRVYEGIELFIALETVHHGYGAAENQRHRPAGAAAARPAPAPAPVYYTRSQVAMAKQIEAIITSDLSRPHTVREFAERFFVSESSVKNYFHGVYGQSIAQYMTGQRMLLAAKLLAQTKLSVIDVAARVGYLNQSKFSAAFRRAYACTPPEYRRSQRLPADENKG